MSSPHRTLATSMLVAFCTSLTVMPQAHAVPVDPTPSILLETSTASSPLLAAPAPSTATPLAEKALEKLVAVPQGHVPSKVIKERREEVEETAKTTEEAALKMDTARRLIPQQELATMGALAVGVTDLLNTQAEVLQHREELTRSLEQKAELRKKQAEAQARKEAAAKAAEAARVAAARKQAEEKAKAAAEAKKKAEAEAKLAAQKAAEKKAAAEAAKKVAEQKAAAARKAQAEKAKAEAEARIKAEAATKQQAEAQRKRRQPQSSASALPSPSTYRAIPPTTEGTSPAWQCLVPSGDSHLQSWPARVRSRISEQFGITNIGGYRGSSRSGDHEQGLALDVMVPINSALGDEVASWAMANASTLNVKYVIWKQHIWAPYRNSEGWRPMEDRGSITQNHYDHVHISFEAGEGSCPAS